MQLDDTDRALVALLSDNARMPLATLARRLSLARSTVQSRIERLERSGVIGGYTLRPGKALDPWLRATVLISIEPRSGPAVIARLASLGGVEHVHTVSGRFDLIALVSTETTEELDTTLDKIAEARGVLDSESLIHLSTKLDRRR